MPKWHFALKREVSLGAHQWDLPGLGARQFVQAHVSVPPTKSVCWQPVPSREETGRIPRNKWLQQLLQTPTPPTPPQLKSSSQGQVASSSSSSQPARSVVLVALLEGNPGSQVSREHTSPHGTKTWEWGPAARHSKAKEEASWRKGELALFQRTTAWGQGAPDKGQLLHTDNQSARAFMEGGRDGATGRNSTVGSGSHEIGAAIVWSVSSWLDYVQLIFSSRVSLFPFLWGQVSELWQLMSWLQSGHHVVNLFHLVGVPVSTRQLIGYGSECCLNPWRRTRGPRCGCR